MKKLHLYTEAEIDALSTMQLDTLAHENGFRVPMDAYDSRRADWGKLRDWLREAVRQYRPIIKYTEEEILNLGIPAAERLCAMNHIPFIVDSQHIPKRKMIEALVECRRAQLNVPQGTKVIDPNTEGL